MPQASLKDSLLGVLRCEFVRNVAIVASGTVAAEAITMAFSPVLTRMYGPEAFGLLGVFVALLSIMTPVAALTYPIAIVLADKDAEAKSLARLSFLVALSTSGFVAILLLLRGEGLLALVGSEAITGYALLIPLSMLFTACIQIAEQWLIRKKQYRITARLAVLQSFILNSSKAGIGWINPAGATLVVLTTAGHAFHAGILRAGITLSKEPRTAADSPEHGKNSLKVLAKKYYDFPVYRAPQVFINAISQNLPVLMLASFFGPPAAGFYAICKTVLGLPSTLIGKSVGDVFYPRISEAARNSENLTRLIFKATIALAAIGLIPFGLILAFGPWLFGFVFGGEWVIAGEYARWLSIMMFFFFINKPSVVAIPVLGLQKGLLMYEFFSTGTKIVAIYLGVIFLKSDSLTIAIFSITSAVTYILLIAWVIISSGFHERRARHATKTS